MNNWKKLQKIVFKKDVIRTPLYRGLHIQGDPYFWNNEYSLKTVE